MILFRGYFIFIIYVIVVTFIVRLFFKKKNESRTIYAFLITNSVYILVFFVFIYTELGFCESPPTPNQGLLSGIEGMLYNFLVLTNLSFVSFVFYILNLTTDIKKIKWYFQVLLFVQVIIIFHYVYY